MSRIRLKAGPFVLVNARTKPMTGGEMIGFMIILWLGRMLCHVAVLLIVLLFHGVVLLLNKLEKWRESR